MVNTDISLQVHYYLLPLCLQTVIGFLIQIALGRGRYLRMHLTSKEADVYPPECRSSRLKVTDGLGMSGPESWNEKAQDLARNEY